MPNNFILPKVVAQESLMLLRSNCVAGGLVYRDYSKEFEGQKKGDTVTIRKPANFEAQEFAGSIVLQNADEDSIPLVLEKHLDVSVPVTSKELTLDLEDFSKQIVDPAMKALGEKLDKYILSCYAQVPSFSGTPGRAPSTLSDLAAIDRVLNEQRVPMGQRYSIVSPFQKEGMFSIDAVTRADARGDEGTALREASMGRIMAMDFFMGQNVHQHVSGKRGTMTLTSAAGEKAEAIVLTLGGGATLKKGDIISIAGVAGLYTVTADLNASGQVGIFPKLPAGAPSGTAVTLELEGTYTCGLSFVPNAFALVMAPLALPAGADKAAMMNFEGMSVRVVYGYDMDKKTNIISFDSLVGCRCIDPRLATRIVS